MSHYNRLQIYYFSGTGNALSAAKWIRQNGEREDIDTTMQSIENIREFRPGQPGSGTLFVFTYPTHGFAPPWLMLKFMWKFPSFPGADAAFVNTKAGAKAGKFFLPGMTGIAQWLPIFIFLFKGFGIQGSVPLDMPHSWTSFFPPNLNRAAMQMTVRCHGIIDNMCSRIFSGRRYFRYTVWTQLWFDIAVSWIAPLYLFMGRFILAKTLFASYTCNNCRICEEYCPVGAIEIRNGMPYWKYYCESCMRCMNICPRESIQSWVTRISLAGYVLYVAGITYTSLNQHLLTALVWVFIFPLYWLFIKMMHIKIFNILFTFTSLTKYWKRHIAAGVRIRDLKL